MTWTSFSQASAEFSTVRSTENSGITEAKATHPKPGDEAHGTMVGESEHSDAPVDFVMTILRTFGLTYIKL